MTTVIQRTRYRGVPYSATQEPIGGWRWKVYPANAQLHAYEVSIPSGFCASHEAAEAAARAAIDAQLDA